MEGVSVFRFVWTVVSLRHEIIIVVRAFDLDAVVRSSRIAPGIGRTVPLHKPRILSKPRDRKVKPATILFRCSFIKFAEPQLRSLLESDNDIIDLNLRRLRRLLLKIQGQLYTTVRVTISSASISRAFMCCTQPIGSSVLFGGGSFRCSSSMSDRFISCARS